jgi:hypothetical protein
MAPIPVWSGNLRLSLDREHVTFIVRTLVHPPERADG